jgi:hypothetical protein
MGKLGRAIAAGVHSGLTTLGAGLQQQARDERVDARLAKEDEFKERQLSIQERDAKLRADAAERQKFMDNIKIKHLKFTEAYADAGGNKHMEAKAMTDLFPDKRIYKYDERASKQVDPATGKAPFAVMNISFLDKDPVTGEVIVDEFTGLPKEIITKAPTDRAVFDTEADYINHIAGKASPEIYFATALRAKTTKQTIDESNAIAEAAAKTQQGKSKLELEKQQAEEKKESAALKKRTDPNLRAGKGGNLDKIKEQGFNQFANNLTKELGVSVSADTARKIAAISDNSKIRGAFLTGVSKALDPDDPTSRSDFIESGVKQGLPREFMDRLFSQAEVAYEARGEETKALTDGWFSQVFDSLLGLFTN